MKRQTQLLNNAGIRLRVEADTLEEMFEAAMQGVSSIMKKEFCNENEVLPVKEEVHVRSTDLSSLLVDFLSEVIRLSKLQNTVFCKLSIDELSFTEINGMISGSYVQTFDTEIISVNYHEINIYENTNDRWESYILYEL